MNDLLDSFWRAALYCLHPRVVLLSLLPLLITAGLAALLGYFFWDNTLAAMRQTFDSWVTFQALLGWLKDIGIGNVGTFLVPFVLLALVLPLLLLLSLLLVSLMMTPALVRLVAARRFPLLERRQGGTFLQSLGFSVGSTFVALAALLISVPFWLVPPLVLVLPPLIWGWLTYRVMSFDALAEHASRDERVVIMRGRRWPLLGMGVVCGYLSAAPALIWALGAVTLVLAPLLVVLSVWLYTLVFAFSALWFAHFLLASLQRLRAEPYATPVVALNSP